jgi:hypothetical protein
MDINLYGLCEYHGRKMAKKGLEYLKYMQTVGTAASRGCPGGWVLYDEQYCLQKARFPASS